MRIIKRRIFINGTAHDIWLGLVNKGYRGKANLQLYYYAGDPAEELHQPHLLKGGFTDENTAIEYGKEFMRTLIKNALQRQQDLPEDRPSDFPG